MLRKSFTRCWPFNRKRTALSVNHPVLLDLLFCGAEVTQADRWTRMLAHWCFPQGHLSQWLSNVHPEPGAHGGDTPQAGRSRGEGVPSHWAAPEPFGANPAPGCQQHRKQRAWLMYMSPCGLWPQPRPTLEPAQAARATGNGRGCIYSHIVFIQRCCFAQIMMSVFTGRGHGICLFRRAS